MTNAPKQVLLSLALLLAAWPASAEPLTARDAFRHVGETAQVRGRATLTFMPSGEVYIDLDGQGDSAPFEGYISRWNRARFRDLATLNGKMVEISGQIGAFRHQPEIFLQGPGQIAVN